MTPTIIIVLLVVAILGYLVSFYNRLSTAKVRIKASIQEIGNQLKRQSDLIPNLVESAKGYLKHEKDIFAMLTDARKAIDTAVASGSGKQIDQAQDLVTKVLGSLRVVVESNPQLQSSGLISNLMNELRDTADKIMYSRRTLIDLSADYNTSIATIPGIWLAPIMGFQPEKGLETPTSGSHIEVSALDTETPKVNL